MYNNDFITRNFATGNNATNVNAPLNIPIRGAQVADTEGTYLSRLVEVRPPSNKVEDSGKVMFQYELVDVTGAVFLFRETFTCSPFVDRWNAFGAYLVDQHGYEGSNDITFVVGMHEIVTLEWVNGFLNIVHREKTPDGFDYKMLNCEDIEEQ